MTKAISLRLRPLEWPTCSLQTLTHLDAFPIDQRAAASEQRTDHGVLGSLRYVADEDGHRVVAGSLPGHVGRRAPGPGDERLSGSHGRPADHVRRHRRGHSPEHTGRSVRGHSGHHAGRWSWRKRHRPFPLRSRMTTGLKKRQRGIREFCKSMKKQA